MCDIKTEAEWEFDLLREALPAALAKSLSSSAADIEIDISGSTFTYPGTGQVTVTLYQGGTVLAAQQFGWTRNGNVLVLSSPVSVDAWASGYSGVTEAHYDLVPFEVDANPGVNTISADTVYKGQVLASSQSTFCYNPHPIPSPHLPNPCI